MQKIWDLTIRKSIQKEFPNDPMMQELHELRARFPFSRKHEIAERIRQAEKKGINFQTRHQFTQPSHPYISDYKT